MPLRSKRGRKEDTVVLDDRAFDAAVVRGVLAVYNDMHYLFSESTRLRRLRASEGIIRDTSESIRRAFEWLPPVLTRRAERADVKVENVRWSSAVSERSVVEVSSALLFTVGAFGNRNSPLLFDKAPVTTAGGTRSTQEQWVNSVLAALPIYSRFLYEAGEFRLVSVPLLTNIERCVAYALALVWMDRHGFRDRVRPCEFLMKDKSGSPRHHYFLADDARQRFCSTAHSNAHRQRELRRRQKEDAE